MTAPLINALYQRYPHLKITLRTGVPLAFLQHKLDMPFDYLLDSSDFGMVNKDAFEVDLEMSLQRYQTFHHEWPDKIKQETAQLKALGADYLLSNIAYLPLAAATQIGLPSIAYCCLNWADIFCHYYGHQASTRYIHEQMLDAYAGAGCFIRPEPAMPMASLTTNLVGPIATLGRNRRTTILESLGLPATTRLVLAAMGGIRTEMNLANWPEIENVHYLVPDQHVYPRNDISAVSIAGISFTDVLCSVDVLFTKPGYGSFSEAACNGIRVLYVERPTWPEHSHLVEWLQCYTPCRSISRQQLQTGAFSDELVALLHDQTTLTPPVSGLPEALSLLTKYLHLN